MKRFLELREFCESLTKQDIPRIEDFLLSMDEWDTIENITSVLSHFEKKTTQMQKVSISLSDFFGSWATIKFELSKLGNIELAQKLLAEMKKREVVLFNNPVLNAAVFLDPRYQQYMPSENKDKAIEFLSRLYRKMESLKRPLFDNDEPSLSESTHEFEGFLNTIYDNTNDNNGSIENNGEQPSSEAVESIDMILKKFIGTKETLKTSIFDYWRNNMHTKPELYSLATVVHSVPPTQTTVERGFSAMALILSHLRTNISDKNLENLLLIRLNRELFEEMCPLD